MAARFASRTIIGLVVSLLLWVEATHAGTVVIDFDDVPLQTVVLPVYSKDGFTLTPTAGQILISNVFSPGDNAAQPTFGFRNDVNSSFIFAHSSALPFDAVSIDLLEGNIVPQTYGVTAIGTKADASIVMQTFTLDGIAGRETFAFSPDFTGLVSLKIAEDASNSFATDIVLVDNVGLAVVPEPSSLSLLGISAVGLLARPRQKHRETSMKRAYLGRFLDSIRRWL